MCFILNWKSSHSGSVRASVRMAASVLRPCCCLVRTDFFRPGLQFSPRSVSAACFLSVPLTLPLVVSCAGLRPAAGRVRTCVRSAPAQPWRLSRDWPRPLFIRTPVQETFRWVERRGRGSLRILGQPWAQPCFPCGRGAVLGDVTSSVSEAQHPRHLLRPRARGGSGRAAAVFPHTAVSGAEKACGGTGWAAPDHAVSPEGPERTRCFNSS